jgi:hypothetical protein
MDAYYAKWNCSKCHAATCEKCHVGYEAKLGHGDQTQEITIDTCDKCHLKKQSATLIGDMPEHKKKGPAPDIHYTIGLTCTDCHNAVEMHGDGTKYKTQLEAVTTKCEDCHNSPGKTVKGMAATQYSTDIGAHKIHEEKLSCTACHSGWALTCNNCHLDTRKGTKPVSDEFYLGVASDGKVKPFMKMEVLYDGASHMGYGEWFSHTVTDKAKDCAFCHDNLEVLCDSCEGEMLGKGGSFIPRKPTLSERHNWLTHPKLHLKKVDCLACHDPSLASPVKDCAQCHAEDSVLLTKVEGAPKYSLKNWDLTNKELIEKGNYVVGSNRIPALDLASILLIILTFAGCAIHGILRFINRRRK